MKKIIEFLKKRRLERIRLQRKFLADKKIPQGKNAGFTFIETLAVLAVTALLASQVGVAAHALIQRAKVSSAKNQIELFKIALQSYYIDCGRFPTQEQGLMALWEKPAMYPVPESWQGPYIDRKIPQDPWGTNYGYFVQGCADMPGQTPEGLPYAIVSYGADGNAGGEGKNGDIISWE